MVRNHGNWLLETGSLYTVPKGRLAARRGREEEGWVENKGFKSLFNSRARLDVGVHFSVPQYGFPPTWVWDRPPLDQSVHWTQSSPLAWRTRRTLRPLSHSSLRAQDRLLSPQNLHALTLAGLRSVPRNAPLSAMETAEGRSSGGSLDRSPSSCRLGALPATAGNRDIDLARSGGEHVHRSGEMGGERRRRVLMTLRYLLPRVRLKTRDGGAV